MSVQAATIKRVQFLTSRWEYDIPHKFVWAIDIYGVSKTHIDNILNQYSGLKFVKVASYQEVYLGGREHTVDEATKAALIAANIDITESNFTAL